MIIFDVCFGVHYQVIVVTYKFRLFSISVYYGNKIRVKSTIDAREKWLQRTKLCTFNI